MYKWLASRQQYTERAANACGAPAKRRAGRRCAGGGIQAPHGEQCGRGCLRVEANREVVRVRLEPELLEARREPVENHVGGARIRAPVLWPTEENQNHTQTMSRRKGNELVAISRRSLHTVCWPLVPIWLALSKWIPCIYPR